MSATILIVDDEENLRLTLSRVLTKAGFTVTTAASGEEALRLLQAGAYELAFIDLMMPGMGGLALLGELRKFYPDMPVLILTAHATLDSAIEAVRAGARDYLVKPADPDRIIARVRDILKERTQPQRQREILSQIQSLVSELNQFSQPGEEQKVNALNMLPPTDPARFLQRGPFSLDLHARHLMQDGTYVPLSPANFDYMVTLVRHAPNPVTYEVFVREAQGYEMTRAEAREMARWRIHELRKAIEEDSKNPRYIITVRGTGYRLAI
ncbi:MAG TPA: response regulator transcription factor [Anaerolineales bacterium]|nr:response regulator transcription factor [Anaerolineales bacterium]